MPKSAALMTLKGHQGAITAVRFSSDGKRLVTTSVDKTARVWDLENAGTTFIDEPAITDGKIVTARAPIDLAAFVHAIDDLLVAA